jgi:lysyl-tRNA synthetase class 2
VTQERSPLGDYYRFQRDGQRRLQLLTQRSRLLGRMRSFFAAREFLEIEAPLLVPSPGLELHLDAFAVPGGLAAADSSPAYLITSPEYQLKRLLCAGFQRIYSLGKVFRRGELGPHHNPEFTMLEWYRAGESWSAVADDVAALFAELATELHGNPTLPPTATRPREIDLSLPWPRLTVSQAMQRYAGVSLRGDEDLPALRAALQAAGHSAPERDSRGRLLSWDDQFFPVFLDHVEPQLASAPPGQPLRPVILHDWPLPLCALARRSPENPAVVERFEAYVAGLELCNGFGELCDADEQRRRLVADADERARRGLPVYPIDERFLAALGEGLPASGGVALGVDRLVMLLLGASHIRDVLAFSADEL